MPPREDDEYGLEPAKKAGTAVADDDYGLEKAGAAAPSEGEEPTEENLPGSTPRLRAAVKSGVAKMQPPTKFEKETPLGYDFAPHKMELQEYAGIPSLHTLGAMAEGAKGVIGSGLQGAYDVALGQANPETGELEHGVGGLVNLNTQGEYAPVQKATALGKKYLTEPAKEEIEKAKAAPGALEAAGHYGAAALPLVGPWAAHLGERAGTGDITGAAGEAVGGVLGGEAMSHPGEVVKGAKAVGKAGLDALGNPLTLGMGGEDMLTKGVRPRARAQGWQEAIQSPGVQRAIIDANAQFPIKSVEDFHDAIDPMKQKIWNEKVQPSIDRQGPKPVDMKPAADNIRKAITPEMRKFDADGVAKLETLANQLDEVRTVADTDRLQKYANAQLESYYGKYPAARRSAFASNPETMGWELARRGIREGLVKAMDEAGESEYEPARRDYGHLTTIEKELERRINPNERKAPTSLYNFLGTAGGLASLLAGHGIAGAAMYGYGKLAERFNRPDVLIRRGIKNLHPPPEAPFTPPPPYFKPLEQFPQGQGAMPPSTAPVQNAAQPPGNFQMENLRPNRTAMWQTQVGAPPPLETGAPRAPYNPPIGPEPAPEGAPAPIQGQQLPLNLPPESPSTRPTEAAPLFNVVHPQAPVEAPQAIGGKGRVAELQPIGYKPSQKAELGSAKRNVVPEQEAQNFAEQTERYKDILRNPKATAEDRTIAQQRLDQMEEVQRGMKAPGPIRTTNVEDLKVGDTFVDEKGDPRRIVDIQNDGTIKTADHTLRDFEGGQIPHIGELNSPEAQLARGGRMHPEGEPVERVKPMVKPGEGAAKEEEWKPPAGLEKGISKDEAVDTKIPIEKLSVSESAYNRASKDISVGRASRVADEPILIFHNTENGQFLVEDGMHRVVEAYRRGDTTLPAKIYSGDYSDTVPSTPEGSKMDLSPMEEEKEEPENPFEMGETERKWLEEKEQPTPQEERTTPVQSSEDAIDALKERVKDQTHNGEERDYQVVPKGQLDPNKLAAAAFLLDDGSAVMGDKGIKSHMQLARELGREHLNDANAIRIVAPDSYELHAMPSEAQLAEMKRLSEGLSRENRQNVHDQSYVYWDFYPEDVKGYSADAVSEQHATDAGTFSDFKRAIDKYYERGIRTAAQEDSPLKAMVSDEDAKAALGRKMKRPEEVGAPKNKALILEKDGKKYYFGNLTDDQFIDRWENHLDPELMQKWRDWYPDVGQRFRDAFGKGKEGAQKLMAWLVSQKNTSPAGGMMNLLRTEDIMGGQRKIMSGGLAEDQIKAMLSGQTPESGLGAKLHDFVDSAMGKNTRTWMGDDPKGGAPGVIDVHSARGTGYVDDALINAIKKQFGDDAAKGLVEDLKGAPSETQYERGSERYNQLAEELNRRNYRGGGWTPDQVQAVDWAAMGKQLGRDMELPEAIFDKNIRRVAYEVKFSPDSPLGKKFDFSSLNHEQAANITREVAEHALKLATDEAGGYVADKVFGPGGWQDARGGISVSPATHADLLASPEAAERVANLLGHLLGQDEVITARPLKSGNGHAFEITEMDSRLMADPAVMHKFWQTFTEAYPKAEGFMPVRNADGSVGIQILKKNGHFSAVDAERLKEAASKAADSVGIEHIKTEHGPADVKSVTNDWKENPKGEGYLDRLKEIGKAGILKRIREEYAPSVEKTVDMAFRKYR